MRVKKHTLTSDNHDDPRLAQANHIMVDTTYSQDGRSTEFFFIEYDPKDSLALFLLERALQSSTGVSHYYVYDDKGKRIPR